MSANGYVHFLDTKFFIERLKKRYSKIDQHLERHFKYNGACL